VYAITPSNLVFSTENPGYNIDYLPGKLYVNPLGPGTRKIKPFLECVEVLTDHPSGFKYAAHFSYENPNNTLIFIPVGTNNDLRSSGSFSGVPPSEFLPGTGSFTIYFDGSKLTWTVKSYEVYKQSSVGSVASSTSSKCKIETLANQLSQSLEMSNDLGINKLNTQGISIESENARIFPNPVAKLLTIQLENISDKEISITDINGRNFQFDSVRRLTNDSLEIDVSGLKTGLYLIKVKGTVNYKVLRIIKM
jgi:hypothetical protein